MAKDLAIRMVILTDFLMGIQMQMGLMTETRTGFPMDSHLQMEKDSDFRSETHLATLMRLDLMMGIPMEIHLATRLGFLRDSRTLMAIMMGTH